MNVQRSNFTYDDGTVESLSNDNTQYSQAIIDEYNTLTEALVSRSNAVSNGWAQVSDRTTWEQLLVVNFIKIIKKVALGHSYGKKNFLNSFLL